MKRFSIIFAFVVFTVHLLFGQEKSIKAKLIDKESGRYINSAIIVNKRTNIGFFVDLDGSFITNIQMKDTLLISSGGYQLKKICFNDSVAKPEYIIALSKLSIDLKTVEVKPQKSLVEIQDALKKIKTPEADKLRQYSGVLGSMSAIQSPITYMYMMFSRMERSKRLVEEMTNNDNRMELMRELMRSYLFNDIVDLNESQIDDFINYCRLSDEFIKNSSEYELAIYIKRRYQQYMAQNDYVPNH